MGHEGIGHRSLQCRHHRCPCLGGHNHTGLLPLFSDREHTHPRNRIHRHGLNLHRPGRNRTLPETASSHPSGKDPRNRAHHHYPCLGPLPHIRKPQAQTYLDSGGTDRCNRGSHPSRCPGRKLRSRRCLAHVFWRPLGSDLDNQGCHRHPGRCPGSRTRRHQALSCQHHPCRNRRSPGCDRRRCHDPAFHNRRRRDFPSRSRVGTHPYNPSFHLCQNQFPASRNRNHPPSETCEHHLGRGRCSPILHHRRNPHHQIHIHICQGPTSEHHQGTNLRSPKSHHRQSPYPTPGIRKHREKFCRNYSDICRCSPECHRHRCRCHSFHSRRHPGCPCQSLAGTRPSNQQHHHCPNPHPLIHNHTVLQPSSQHPEDIHPGSPQLRRHQNPCLPLRNRKA
mmetsp:Transcript_1983/g.4521  ORF Transcript_1983/g.4521 Transcript_1983/m.4521 type:complete len:393 (-) Transcript_1983:802-1980(-)